MADHIIIGAGYLAKGAINAVNGYRYQAAIFGAAPFHAAPGTTGGPPPGAPSGSPAGGGGTGRGDGGGDTLTVNLLMPDGTVLGSVVLKEFKAKAQRQIGNTTEWAKIQ